MARGRVWGAEMAEKANQGHGHAPWDATPEERCGESEDGGAPLLLLLLLLLPMAALLLLVIPRGRGW